MTGPTAAGKVRPTGKLSRHEAGTSSKRPGEPFDLSRLPLHSKGDLLAMQGSVGNHAVAHYIASIQRDAGSSRGDRNSHQAEEGGGDIQRRIERGSGTGWGVFGWVEGGEAIWNRIDRGFNTELFNLRSELQALSLKASARGVGLK